MIDWDIEWVFFFTLCSRVLNNEYEYHRRPSFPSPFLAFFSSPVFLCPFLDFTRL